MLASGWRSPLVSRNKNYSWFRLEWASWPCSVPSPSNKPTTEQETFASTFSLIPGQYGLRRHSALIQTFSKTFTTTANVLIVAIPTYLSFSHYSLYRNENWEVILPQPGDIAVSSELPSLTLCDFESYLKAEVFQRRPRNLIDIQQANRWRNPAHTSNHASELCRQELQNAFTAMKWQSVLLVL